jgi:hypothetical protein
MKIFLIGLPISAMLFFGCQSGKPVKVDGDMEKQLQEMFVNAKEGDVIELPEGSIQLGRPLILDGVNGVTIRGKGIDKTILSFKDQKDGAEGIRITASGVAAAEERVE